MLLDGDDARKKGHKKRKKILLKYEIIITTFGIFKLNKNPQYNQNLVNKRETNNV